MQEHTAEETASGHPRSGLKAKLQLGEGVVAAGALFRITGVDPTHIIQIGPHLIGQSLHIAGEGVHSARDWVALPADLRQTAVRITADTAKGVIDSVTETGSSLAKGDAARSLARNARTVDRFLGPTRKDFTKSHFGNSPMNNGPVSVKGELKKRAMNTLRNWPPFMATEYVVTQEAKERMEEVRGDIENKIEDARDGLELATFDERVALKELGIPAGLDLENGICDETIPKAEKPAEPPHPSSVGEKITGNIRSLGQQLLISAARSTARSLGVMR